MAPKVGPIRGDPSSSATSIPARTIPGTTTIYDNKIKCENGSAIGCPSTFASVVDDVVLGGVHVQGAHAGDAVDESEGLQTLHATRAEGAVMATTTHQDL